MKEHESDAVLMRSVRWLLSPGGTLKQRAARGGVWLLLGEAANRSASVLKLAVLGRLLSPIDFGLMGIALVVFQWLGYFTEIGVDAALIQKPGPIRPYLNTAWTIQILRSLAIALALLFGAPFAAQFFKTPAAAPVIRAIAAVIILYALMNPAVVLLRKELDFRKDVLWRLPGVLVGLAVGIITAFLLRNVWALVLSALTAVAAQVISSYRLQPYRPQLHIDWALARELMRFGKWMLASNVLVFFELYLDSVLVGRVLGATTLGLYQMACQVAMLPTAQIALVVCGVMFPALSKLRDREDLRRAFLSTLQVLSTVVVPLGCFLTVFADPLIRILLGSKWIPIRECVQALAWAGAAKAVGAGATALFLAMGIPRLTVSASVVKLAVFGGLVYPFLTSSGMTGVAVALAASSLAALLYQFFRVTRLVNVPTLRVAATFKPGLLGCLPFLAARLLVSPSPSPVWYAAVGAAVAVYFAVLYTVVRPHLEVFKTKAGPVCPQFALPSV